MKSSDKNFENNITRQKLSEAFQKKDKISLISLWQKRNRRIWANDIELYNELGNFFLKLSEPLLAYDVLNEALTASPDGLRSQQLLALALARSGAPERANSLLSSLQKRGHKDQETLGLLARTHKDLIFLNESYERRHHLKQALKLYLHAYELSKGYWSAINAATMALLLNRKEYSQKLANEVYINCLDEISNLKKNGGDQYWALATLGEASLIIEEYQAAEDWYSRAYSIGAGRYGDLNSTRRNARLIMQHLDMEDRIKTEIENCFQIPSVVVFSGHMIDRPGRAAPRFPACLEQNVASELLKTLKSINTGFGYASAACGSDILFLEALYKNKCEINIVLPYERDEFVKNSVDFISGANWKKRFDRIMTKAGSVFISARNMYEQDAISYEYANLVLIGMASLKAEQLGTKLNPLVVWNKKSGDGIGGTASAISLLEKQGYETHIIDLSALIANVQKQPVLISNQPDEPKAAVLSEKEPQIKPSLKFETKIVSILFADAYHFSEIKENQIPFFASEFLGLVGSLIDKNEHKPIIKNTWGDGLYFVFENVRDAGLFALKLCESVNKTNWAEKSLPASLNLRIALHSGPAYSLIDPITKLPTFVGSQVNYAARIEPITPVGKVYASQNFSALAAAEKIKDFKCEYVGQIPFAKSYGIFPLFHVSFPEKHLK